MPSKKKKSELKPKDFKKSGEAKKPVNASNRASVSPEFSGGIRK